MINNINNYINKIKKPVCAGYLIGLFAEVYLRCENRLVGATLFGLGLLTICAFDLNLFTGVVGGSTVKKSLPFLWYNAIGVGIAVIVLRVFPDMLALGIACGSLVQIGVSLYPKHPWATVLCVAAFLLGGFRHCIVLIYYSYQYTFLKWLLIFVLTVIGNIIGAKIVAFCGVKKNNKE